MTQHETGDLTGTPQDPQRKAEPERFFNADANRAAVRNGWTVFHVDGSRVVRGRGFPDLAMYRQNPETGAYEMLVAKLKRDAYSDFGGGQEEGLEAFRQMGITTKVWRCDNLQDREELDDILQNGTRGQGSVTSLVSEGSDSPIPRSFRGVMVNTIESIQGTDLRTGEKARLRRMDISNPDAAIFWELMTQRGMPRNADIGRDGASSCTA